MLSPVRLTCEHLDSPLGIDTPRPRLSWVLQADRRGEAQSAYQILVASSAEALAAGKGDKWDSGRVASGESSLVEYSGGALASGERCWWKVRAWDRDGNEGPWSAPAWFEMGLMQASDWQGSWIAAPAGVSAPLFRKAFTLDAPVRRARLHICGLGWHEASINGCKVGGGDRLMDPAPTWYDNILSFPVGSRCLYVSHDVTALLGQGPNALGVFVGHGWWSSDNGSPVLRRPFRDRPILRAQLEIELADGRRVTIVTDESWKAAASPITANDICQGEDYDARLELDGWDRAGFDDSAWAATSAAAAPSGPLEAQAMEPARITQRFRPVRMLETPRGTVIFDFGQYIAGFSELRVRGPRGAKVTLAHAGRVNYEAAALDTRNAMLFYDSRQTDSYTLKGQGVEVWRPRFTLHGFRYVELIGYPGPVTLDAVEGCEVRTAVATAGRFECSNDMINRVHHNVYWTFRGSFQGIPQDAAERAERVAWLGDPGFVAEDYLLNFSTAAFWTKWLADIRASQKEDGVVPYICPPNWHDGSYRPWPCWECSYSLFVWHVYRFYGDKRLLQEHYEGLRKQVESFRGSAKDLILPEALGDHMEPGDGFVSSFAPTRTPAELTGTAYFFYCAEIFSRIAKILGRADDAAAYGKLAEEIKTAFNGRFLDAEKNQYGSGSQTANAVALFMGLVPQDRQAAVLNNLVEDIRRRGNRLSTGIIGTDALEQTLPAFGRSDVMFDLATQTRYPSWGYGVVNGQTTISEDFECSYRHSVSMKMFGSTEKFFFQDLAGLAMAAPGWRRMVIRPQAVGDLTWASGSLETVLGPAAAQWRRGEGRFELTVTVPVGATAEVQIPKLGVADVAVREGGVELLRGGQFKAGPAGITAGRETETAIVLEVGPGMYEFELTGRATGAKETK